MLYFSTTKKISLLIVCLIGFFLALPNFWNANIPLLPKQTINLGLDLRGGSYLLLEVDTNPVIKQKLQNKVISLRKALKDKNIKYSNLNIQNKSIKFQLSSSEIDLF